MYLRLDSIISEAQVLQVCGGVGLHRGELVLQHMNDLRQLGVTPGKLPGTQTERYQTHTHARAQRHKQSSTTSAHNNYPPTVHRAGAHGYTFQAQEMTIDNYYIAGLLLFSQYKRKILHWGSFIWKTLKGMSCLVDNHCHELLPVNRASFISSARPISMTSNRIFYWNFSTGIHEPYDKRRA